MQLTAKRYHISKSLTYTQPNIDGHIVFTTEDPDAPYYHLDKKESLLFLKIIGHKEIDLDEISTISGETKTSLEKDFNKLLKKLTRLKIIIERQMEPLLKETCQLSKNITIKEDKNTGEAIIMQDKRHKFTIDGLMKDIFVEVTTSNNSIEKVVRNNVLKFQESEQEQVKEAILDFIQDLIDKQIITIREA